MDQETTDDTARPAPRRRRRLAANLLICLVLVAAGIAGAVYFTRSAPKALKRPPEKITPLVVVEAVYPETRRVIVPAMGTVVPARELTLKPQVAGKVISIAPEFTEGGLLKAGQPVLEIEPDDYRLAVARKQSAVIDATYALKIEMGHQEVARREWDLLRDGSGRDAAEDPELALRKPHLDKVRADLAAADADLRKAQLDLERTRIQVPFNAVVRDTSVEVGSQVSAQEPLAELAGTDAYHVRVSIPSDRLKWIAIPGRSGETGSDARVQYRNGFTRNGRVDRLLSDLEEEGRMARILVSVADPLGLQAGASERPPLLIGEYVTVEIEGREVEGVYRIPRTALRDNTRVWIVGGDETLDIREVETVWRDAGTVLIREGIEPGDRLVVSDLSIPVAGMPVRVEGRSDDTPPGSPEGENVAGEAKGS